MDEHKKEAIRQYFERISRDQENSREELEARVIDLNMQLAAERLELAEQRIERLVRQRGISYMEALDTVVAELEERELAAQTRADQRNKQRTITELEQRGEA